MMKRLIAIGVVVLLLLAVVFAVTQIDAPLPPSDGSVASSGGKSVADYLKIFDAGLLGNTSASGVVAAPANTPSNVAVVNPPQAPLGTA
jgi:hypothetical protein